MTATNTAGSTAAQSPTAGHALPGWPVNFGAPTISAAQPQCLPDRRRHHRYGGHLDWHRPDHLHLPVAVLRLAQASSVRSYPAAPRAVRTLRPVTTSVSDSSSGSRRRTPRAPTPRTRSSPSPSPATCRRTRSLRRFSPARSRSGSTLTSDTGTFSGCDTLPLHVPVAEVPAGRPAVRPDSRRDGLLVRVAAFGPGRNDPLAGDRRERWRLELRHLEPHAPDPAEDPLRAREHRSADACRQAGSGLDSGRDLRVMDRRGADPLHVHLAPLRRHRAGLHRDPERLRHHVQAQGRRRRVTRSSSS